MASLREIKDRIGSVRSTLKITSAMKLVASAKLRKAQQAAQSLRAYEDTLSDILASALPSDSRDLSACSHTGSDLSAYSRTGSDGDSEGARLAVVTIASNSSLCGSFNGNVIRKTLEVLSDAGKSVRGSAASGVDVFPLGRRIADPLRRLGYVAAAPSLNELVAHPGYEAAAALADELARAVNEGVYSKVIVVYNHFVTTSRQEVRCETLLPYVQSFSSEASSEQDYIIEPSAGDILKTLLPQLLRLKLYATILDSIAAEHAARMIAMQTATDNAKDLLDSLTLEYNKGRQQQITAEILDIVGGSQQ